MYLYRDDVMWSRETLTALHAGGGGGRRGAEEGGGGHDASSGEGKSSCFLFSFTRIIVADLIMRSLFECEREAKARPSYLFCCTIKSITPLTTEFAWRKLPNKGKEYLFKSVPTPPWCRKM